MTLRSHSRRTAIQNTLVVALASAGLSSRALSMPFCLKIFNRPKLRSSHPNSGFGDLTKSEIDMIQSEVDRIGKIYPSFKMWIVGSAAERRRRRNLASARRDSDIDYMVEREFIDQDGAIPTKDGVSMSRSIRKIGLLDLPGLDIWGFHAGTPDRSIGPVILFRPNRPPEFLEKQ